jgi:ATP-binding cassette, subfamily B, bacterial CvaB/MchF/RaxB
MSFMGRISFGFSPKLPIILQTEASECALACIAMVAGFHNHFTDLMSLRARFPISLKGATLGNLISVATQLGLGTRPLRLALNEVEKLKCPCILHWNFNHFVVMQSCSLKGVTIHDPAVGVRFVKWSDVSRAFTGIALEVWPTTDFSLQRARPRLKLSALLGRISGLRSSAAQILLLALALEAFAILSPFFMQWIVDNVVTSADKDLLSTLTLGFGILLLMQQIVWTARSYALMYMSTTLSVQWRSNVFSHLLSLPTEYFEKRHLGDVVSRFGATEIIQHGLTSSFLEAMLDGLMSTVTLCMMFLYSPVLTVVTMIATVLYTLSRWVWYRPLREATEEQIVHAARQQSHLLESIRGVRPIKLFRRQEERRSSWLALLVDEVNAGLRVQRLNIVYRLINGLLYGVESLVIINLGAHLIFSGAFTVGVLIAFCAFKTQFDSRMSSLIDKVFEYRMLQLQGERLADIVCTEPERTGGKRYASDLMRVSAGIRVRGLRFSYGNNEPFVLNGLDFEISPGRCAAIVGGSGCGKTTLVNILLGILAPTSGEVEIGGIPIHKLDVDDLRRLVGTVLQDDSLFAGSIAENISFFDASPDRKWIEHCAELAAIADAIAEMPMGYNTLVGDMGTVLSGGQKQRILLARALYKRPRILILDEATSHLDLTNERRVNGAIKSLKMTRIIIAHRPETIASAEQLIIIRDGLVIKNSVLCPAVVG